MSTSGVHTATMLILIMVLIEHQVFKIFLNPTQQGSDADIIFYNCVNGCK
jgi:hypothetical protein